MSHPEFVTDQERVNGKTRFEEAAPATQASAWRELWQFAMENKKWWLLPIVVVLGLIGFVAAFGTTGAAPFIYTLF